jgi:hypothetical protein
VRIVEIPPGARLYDTIAPLTTTALRALKEAGADGVIAYLGGNLTAEAIADAHGLGLGVCPVNYSRAPGWTPSATLGEGDATTSLLRLTKLNVPTAGLVDWCDVEGPGAGDLDGYVEAWCHVIGDQGRIAGGYIGYGLGRSAAQIYAWPFTRYWESCSDVPKPGCGWCLQQIDPANLQRGGVEVDVNFARADYRGRSATWLVGS